MNTDLSRPAYPIRAPRIWVPDKRCALSGMTPVWRAASRRTDFPQAARFATKGGAVREVEVLVLEIPIGLDRCLYNWAIGAASRPPSAPGLAVPG